MINSTIYSRAVRDNEQPRRSVQERTNKDSGMDNEVDDAESKTHEAHEADEGEGSHDETDIHDEDGGRQERYRSSDKER